MSKYTEISIFTGKHLWWRPFKYCSRYEGLQLLKKVSPSQMLSCETYEVLQSIIFKENCWQFGRIACYISNKSTCLGLRKKYFHKQLIVFALKIFEDNQNITKVESNILLTRPAQQRKCYLAEAVTTHECFAKKVLTIMQTLRKTSLPGAFFRLQPCNFV